jgi:hypothetical protein
MNLFLWILQIILAVKFVSVAFTHALRRDKAEMQQAIEKIGTAARPLLGIAALGTFLCSLCLVLPALIDALGQLAPWAAALLALMSLASIGFHVAGRDSPKIFVSLVLFAMAAFVAYGRWAIIPI